MITVLRDLRGAFGVARDQLQRPTCLVFAVSDTHASLRGSWSPLSCEYLFHHAIRRAASNPDLGATFKHVLAALRDDGQPAEAGWPYLSGQPADPADWLPPAHVGDIFRRHSDAGSMGFEAAWQRIMQGSPVVIGMTLSAAFFTGNSVVDAPEPIDPALRHALVGLACGQDGNRRYILIRNSWGTRWGDHGHAWLSESYLAPRLANVVHLKEAA